MVSFLAMLMAAPVASADQYLEDFTTTASMDSAFTTAWWDTTAGELKLHPYRMTVLGTAAQPVDARDVVASGRYAYVAAGAEGFAVVSVQDPTNPVRVGTVAATSDANRLAVRGRYAFVAAGSDGLVSVDITDPAVPVALDSFTMGGYAHDVALGPQVAWLAVGSAGLQRVFISNPAFLSGLPPDAVVSDARGIALEDSVLYVAAGDAGLVTARVVSGSPVVWDQLDTPGQALDVVLSGDLAFIADGAAGIRVVNVSDPGNLTGVGAVELPGVSCQLTLKGNHLYVADSLGVVRVVDVLDPTNPVETTNLSMPAAVRGVFVAGTHAYAATSSGLATIQASDLLSPTIAGSSAVQARRLVIRGDLGYAVGAGGLHVLDLSSPDAPIPLGSATAPQSANDVAVTGHRAVVAAGDVWLYDVGDPWHPAFVDSAQTPGALRVLVDGSWVFAPGTGLALLVVSPSDISLFNHNPMGNALCLAYAGEYLYLPANDSLQVLEGPPFVPVVASGPPIPGPTFAIALQTTLLHIPTWWGQVHFVDVSDPLHATSVGTASVGSAIFDWFVEDNLALGVEYSALRLFDLTNLPSMTDVATLPIPGTCRSVTVWGDHAYVSAQTGGLLVVRLFQRRFATAENGARSKVIATTADPILRVRVMTTQVDSIRWELSADDGSNWQEIMPDGAWYDLAYPGTSLRWRSTHYTVEGIRNPSCSDLSIEWLSDLTEASQLPAPIHLRLDPPSPNPFGENTTIRWAVPRRGRVVVSVFDVGGRLVRTLCDGDRPAGWEVAVWDGTNADGQPVPSGVYLCRLMAGRDVETRRVVRVR